MNPDKFIEDLTTVGDGYPKTSYDAGYDCGLNGANIVNCHFWFFSTKEKTKEWEKGRDEAIKKINERKEAK